MNFRELAETLSDEELIMLAHDAGQPYFQEGNTFRTLAVRLHGDESDAGCMKASSFLMYALADRLMAISPHVSIDFRHAAAHYQNNQPEAAGYPSGGGRTIKQYVQGDALLPFPTGETTDI